MKHRILLLIAAVAGLSACHRSEGPNPGDIAAQAAKVYYEYLLQGKPEQWVDGFIRRDSIPSSYRRQLVDNARMFMRQQSDDHGGLKSVSVRGSQFNVSDSTAIALLGFQYAEGDSEQVAVPMVCVGGVWYMK